ncbi:MFS transporter [Telmatospirillum siberiense]|uniref:MFS transporter n=1 Tax=Telmatospirillum siberiense TaxID=382514 RepID=A0A2N3PTZ0_9PROT|nr:MFS transporter [Telmatospirillum siberiense]PKU23874.1 MFS transporter [Telmatospirillum siberiense]
MPLAFEKKPVSATTVPPDKLSAGLMALFAFSVGVTVLSLYASQPLIGLIQADFGLTTSKAGLVTTFTLLGYASGLLLLVPLTDLVENRTLIVATLGVDAVALASVAYAPNLPLFFAACYLSGVTASAIQMLVPVAAQLSADAQRGRVVGNVMSGLMLGILLSRPIASLFAEIAGWRSFYITLAGVIAVLAVLLARVLPRRRPYASRGYGVLIASMLTILREEPVLRHRAAYQALCMGAFGVFWTSVALRLSQPPFSLNQSGIALFALTGAAGAFIAPIAGRIGDRGWTRGGTFAAHASIIIAMVLAELGGDAVFRAIPGVPAGAALVILSGAAVLLDLGVIGDQTLGRRAINLVRPEARGRMNGLFTGLFFFGAAAGSGLSGIAWAHAGWLGVCGVGTAFGIAALLASGTAFKATVAT